MSLVTIQPQSVYPKSCPWRKYTLLVPFGETNGSFQRNAPFQQDCDLEGFYSNIVLCLFSKYSCDPRDRFFYPILRIMIDSYITCCIDYLFMLTQEVSNNPINLRTPSRISLITGGGALRECISDKDSR